MRSLICILALALAGAISPAKGQGITLLPDAVDLPAFIGENFSQAFTCVGCVPAAGQWTLRGALPAGLTFNSASRVLSGVPTTRGTYPIDVSTFSPNAGTLTRHYSIDVDYRLRLLTDPALAPATAGIAVSRDVRMNYAGFSDAFITELPNGVSLRFSRSSEIANLSGIFPPVTAPTTFSFALAATYCCDVYIPQSLNQAFTIVVNPAPQLTATFAAGQVGGAYTGSLAATGGTTPLTYSVTGALPAGLQLNPSTGAVTGTTTVAGQYTFQAIVTDANGAIASVPVTVAIAGPALAIATPSLPATQPGSVYAQTLTASGGVPPYIWSIAAGALPDGLALSAAGLLSGATTAAGTSTFTLAVTDSVGQKVTREYSIVVGGALAIATATLADAVQGIAYSATMAASGGAPPYAFFLSVGGLPAGLSLSRDGTLSGTPTAAGTFNFSVAVSDTQRVATQSLQLVVHQPLRFETTALPQAQAGSPYTAQVTAADGLPPYQFSLAAGALPTGLTLDDSGTLAGTPTAGPDAQFKLRATDQAGSALTADFTLHIVPGPSITTQSLPNGTLGSDYRAALAATGADPLAWSVTAGALPGGLSLNSTTGEITGRPTAPGSFPFTISVADGSTPPVSTTRAFTIAIQAPPLPAVTFAQLQATAAAASQPSFGIALAGPYPVDLTGTATIAFQPDAGPTDPDVRFANGAAAVDFRIPAGQSTAAPLSNDVLAFQAGTTAGTISIAAAIKVAGQPLDPNPAVKTTVRVERAAPAITTLRINRLATGGFEVVAIGFSNTREISGATLRIAGTGVTATDIPVAVTAFQTWYAAPAAAQFGTQFQFTVPFTFSQGSITALSSVQLTLTNAVGSTTATASF
jgi:hypothetical protein